MHKTLKTISILISLVLISFIIVKKVDTIEEKLKFDFDLTKASLALINEINNGIIAIEIPNKIIDFNANNSAPFNETNDNDTDEDNVEWDEFNKTEHDSEARFNNLNLSLKYYLDEQIISAILDKIPTPPPES